MNRRIFHLIMAVGVIGAGIAVGRVSDAGIPVSAESNPMVAEDQDKFHLWLQPSFFRGAAVHPYSPYGQVEGRQYVSEKDFQALRDQGANIVSLNYPGPFRVKPPYDIDAEALEYLDNAIAWAKKVGLYVVIHFRNGPGKPEETFFSEAEKEDETFWYSEIEKRKWIDMWRFVADRYKEQTHVVGYNLMVEPHPEDPVHQPPLESSAWNQLARKISAGIREVDQKTPIIISSTVWANPVGFNELKPTGDPRTIYSFHMYEPFDFTHQGFDWAGKGEELRYSYPGRIPSDLFEETRYWDRAVIEEALEPVITFQNRYHVPIFVGEFGANRKVPTAATYLEDLLSIFEDHGWSYTYYVWHDVGNGFEYEKGVTDDVGEEESPYMALFKRYWNKSRYFKSPGLLIAKTETQMEAKNQSGVSTNLSKLRVSGNRIVNEEEQEIRLRGVNFTDPFVLDVDDLNGDGASDRHFDEIQTDFERVKAMGANVVRIAIYPGFYFLIGEKRYLIYMDRVVDLAKKHGLYLIFSYHVIGRPGAFYEAESDNMLTHLGYTAQVHYSDTNMAIEFWDVVAARYGKENHVLFEIWNEPADNPDDPTDDLNWTNWRSTGELLIETIRQHSDNIVLGPGLNYTNDLSAVPTNPYSDSNLVYVAHVYPNTVPKGEDQVSEWERLFGFLAETYPVIVSEWGFHDGGKDETTSGTLEGFGRPLLDYLNQKNIHWVAFVYHPPDAEPPMLENDWATLNEFGEFVKERLSRGSATTKTLKELAAARGIRIGSNYDYELASDVHDRIFEQEFNAMTVGFFGEVIYPSGSKEAVFSETDPLVSRATALGMEIFGQSLVWFEEIPAWVKSTPLDQVETAMFDHIDTVVGRYAGRVKLWNVVNEAIDDEGNMRLNHRWAEAMGAEYIDKAFIRAHAQDPAAILYYNDYGMESNTEKYNAVKRLLKDLLRKGVPVYALGWQMHVTPGSFDPATLLERFNEIADLGLDNYITELDVELPDEPTPADYEAQKQTYKTVVKTFLAARRHETIVIWGLRDGSPYWLTKGHPLLFDESFRKKPAYFGVQKALSEA